LLPATATKTMPGATLRESEVTPVTSAADTPPSALSKPARSLSFI
jgi:hypothetical protein